MEHVVSHQSYATSPEAQDYDIEKTVTKAESDFGDEISKEDPFLVSSLSVY